MTEYHAFTDSGGVAWKVYRVAPPAVSEPLERLRDSLAPLRRERRRPWLLFESDTGERRRLAPVPDEWNESTTTPILESLCARAERVPPAPARREADRPPSEE